MIYDKLANIENYLGCNENLDVAIQYILSHDLKELPMGKTYLKDELVYINVMEAVTAPAEQRKYEIHKNYMDIQIDLAGTEIIQIGDGSVAEPDDEYNPETDFGTVTCANLTSCVMGEGNFIVCMPEEPHKPGISPDKDNNLIKCVFKVHK